MEKVPLFEEVSMIHRLVMGANMFQSHHNGNRIHPHQSAAGEGNGHKNKALPTSGPCYLNQIFIIIIIIIIIIIQRSIPGEGFSIPIYKTNSYIKIKIPIYSVYLKSICL